MATKVRTPNTIDVSGLPEEIGVVAAMGYAAIASIIAALFLNLPSWTEDLNRPQRNLNLALLGLIFLVVGALALSANPDPTTYVLGIGAIILALGFLGFGLWDLFYGQKAAGGGYF